MGSLPKLEQLLHERGNDPLPPEAGGGARFRRAFMHGRAFTSQEVTAEFGVSGTMLPNAVKALRELGYVIESKREGDTMPQRIRHRVVNPEHTPAPTYGPPVEPNGDGYNRGLHTADTDKIRAALDSGVVIDRAWCDANGVKFHNAKNVLKTKDGAAKYERVKAGVYRRRIGKPKAASTTGTSAAARIREHLEAGHIVDHEWIRAAGITPSNLHSFVNSARNRGLDIERLPNGGGYRLVGTFDKPRGRPPAQRDNDRLPTLPGMDHQRDLEPPTLPPYPLLAEQLQVRGVSLTDDGTIQVALRNGAYLWVAEVVGQHKLADA